MTNDLELCLEEGKEDGKNEEAGGDDEDDDGDDNGDDDEENYEGEVDDDDDNDEEDDENDADYVPPGDADYNYTDSAELDYEVDDVDTEPPLTMQQLRDLQNYSTVARWMVLEVDLAMAKTDLDTWLSRGTNSIVTADFPRDALLEPTENCDCVLCSLKTEYRRRVEHFNTLVIDFNEAASAAVAARNLSRHQEDAASAASNQPHSHEEDATSASSQSHQEGGEEESVMSEYVEEQKRKFANMLEGRSEEEIQEFLKGLVNNKRELLAANAREAAAKREMLAREAVVKREMLSANARKAAANAREAAANAREAAANAREAVANREKLAAMAETAAGKARNAAVDVYTKAAAILKAHEVTYDYASYCASLGNTTADSQKGTALSPGENILPKPRKLPKRLLVRYEKLDPVEVAKIADDVVLELDQFHEQLSKKLKEAKLIKKVGKGKKFAEKCDITKEFILNSDDTENWAEKDIYFSIQPGLEKEMSHPLLGALMHRITSIKKSYDREPSQAVCNLIHSERNLWVDSATQVRRVDFSVQQVHECPKVLHPFSDHVPIEVKPLKRAGKGLASLHREGGEQVIGHLAKQILHYFELGGIGCNYRCRGVVLTLVSAEIFEMELTGVGTEHVDVKTRRTLPFFLYDRATTKYLLFGERANKKKNVLPKFQFKVSNPSFGFALLLGALSSPSDESLPFGDMHLCYRGSDDETERPHPLGELLGFGSFSFVYRLGDIPNSFFLKVARNPSYLPGLKNELDILLHLHKNETDHRIPKATTTRLGIFCFRRLCFLATIPALCLSGIVGTAASMCMRFTTEQLIYILDEVNEALRFAHRQGVCHLDVRPSNIIVEVADGTIQNVQLVDWGNAKLMSKSAKGFCGSKPFAHDEIHAFHAKKSSCAWYPKAEYDFASLAFTMVALLDNLSNEVPWPDFWGSAVDEKMLDGRMKMSRSVIDKSDLNAEQKQLLKGYLNTDDMQAQETLLSSQVAQPTAQGEQPPTQDVPTHGATPPTPAQSELTPPQSEPTRAQSEPTPAQSELMPAQSEPTPTQSEPTPTQSEPTPTQSEPTPTQSEPTPTQSEPTPTLTHEDQQHHQAVPGELFAIHGGQFLQAHEEQPPAHEERLRSQQVHPAAQQKQKRSRSTTAASEQEGRMATRSMTQTSNKRRKYSR